MLWLLCLSVTAQQLRPYPAPTPFRPIHCKIFTIEEGLPDGTVNAICKDSLGFMWIGTLRGVARFDGYSFKTFQGPPYDSSGFRGSIVYAMITDGPDYLWIATVGGGLNRINLRTEEVTNYQHSAGDSTSLSHNDVYALCLDRTGRLWVGTKGGLDEFQQGRFIHHHPSPAEPDSHVVVQVTAIAEDPMAPGVLWAGTWGDGFFRYDVAARSFTHERAYVADVPVHGSGHIRFLYFSPASHDRLWLGTNGGLFRYDLPTRQFRAFLASEDQRTGLGSNLVRCIVEGDSGTFWIGTSGGGLHAFDPVRNHFTRHEHDPRRPGSLSNNNVLCLYRDEQGLTWAGTREGLCRFADPQATFTVFQHDAQDPSSLSNDFIYSIIEDRDGQVWIASEGGLNRFDPLTRRFTSYRHDPRRTSTLLNDNVRSVYEDRSGVLWVGNTRGFLHRFDRRSGTFRSIQLPENRANASEIRTIYETSDRRLLVGGMTGLFEIDRRQWTYRPVDLGLPPTGPPVAMDFTVMVEDGNGGLWIGTDRSGLIRYDLKTRRSHVFPYDPSRPSGLTHSRIRHLMLDRSGTLLVAVGQGGLLAYTEKDSSFSPVAPKFGFVNNIVVGCFEDPLGRYWVTTEMGLFRYDRQYGTLRSFGIRHGLLVTGFNSRAFCMTTRGEAFVGGTNGVVSFWPARFVDNTVAPQVVITRISAFDRAVASDTSLPFLSKIVLPWDHNFITIEYAALDFTDPTANTFEYRLEGVDPQTVAAEHRRSASYTDLAPGRYLFAVRGTNHHGVWSAGSARLSVIIEAPWWRSWWAYFAYVGILGMVGLGAYRVRQRRVRLQRELELEHVNALRLAEVDRLKSQFLANISHELRTPLTLIQGPVDELLTTNTNERDRERLSLVRRNSEKLLKLIDQLLHFTRVEAGTVALEVARQDVIPILHRATDAFASQAVRKGLIFRFAPTMPEIWGWIDADKLEHIVENLVSNAVKFTSAGGQVNVLASHEHGELIIVVEDTGSGIPPQHLPHVFERFYRVDKTHKVEGTGIGLSLTKELVEIHRGRIRIDSEWGIGTTVSVSLPLEGYLKSEMVEAPARTDAPLHPSILEAPTTGLSTIADGERPQVLVVEDNDDARAFIGSSLNGDFDIHLASSGREALGIAQHVVPDVVVSDVMMPGMDGYELCQSIKSDERTSHIPVILLTALADRRDRIAGLELGADEYLTKPFDSQELRLRLRNLLRQRDEIRNHHRRTALLTPTLPKRASMEDAFLQKVNNSILAHLADERYGIEVLSQEVALSRTQVYRKLKALTGMSPVEYIRRLRLLRAHELLGQRTGSVGEIAFQTGFSNASWFAKCYREEFGVAPSETPRIERGGSPP